MALPLPAAGVRSSLPLPLPMRNAVSVTAMSSAAPIAASRIGGGEPPPHGPVEPPCCGPGDDPAVTSFIEIPLLYGLAVPTETGT